MIPRMLYGMRHEAAIFEQQNSLTSKQSKAGAKAAVEALPEAPAIPLVGDVDGAVPADDRLTVNTALAVPELN